MSRLSAYRGVGASRAYPQWLRDLDGKSGAYVIRSLAGDVLYVGESHKGRLRKTIVRHLQGWRRAKKWWSGWFGQQHDPGTTYPRGDVEIAVLVTSAASAVDEQNRLIARLKPRDNIVGADEVPF